MLKLTTHFLRVSFTALYTHALKTIYVDRDSVQSRQEAKWEIVRRVTTLGDWPQVVLFPEG